jgi:uncharacterized phage protein (TIGR02216 family)
MSNVGAFPWVRIFEVGVRSLGLSPQDLWDLSPAEFRILAGGDSAAPMGRRQMDDLLAAFPDGGPVSGLTPSQGEQDERD